MSQKKPLWRYTNENGIDMGKALTAASMLKMDVKGGLTEHDFERITSQLEIRETGRYAEGHLILERDDVSRVDCYRDPQIQSTGDMIPIEGFISAIGDIEIVKERNRYRQNQSQANEDIAKKEAQKKAVRKDEVRTPVNRRAPHKLFIDKETATHILENLDDYVHMINDLSAGNQHKPSRGSSHSGGTQQASDVREQHVSHRSFFSRVARYKDMIERDRASEYMRRQRSDPESLVNRFPKELRLDSEKTHASEVYKWVAGELEEGGDILLEVRAIAASLPKEKRHVGNYWVEITRAVKCVMSDPWARKHAEGEPVDFDFFVELVRHIDEDPNKYSAKSVDTIPQGLWAIDKLVGRGGEPISAQTLEWGYVGPARYVLKRKEEIGGLLRGVYQRLDLETREGLHEDPATAPTILCSAMTPTEHESFIYLNDPSQVIRENGYRKNIIYLWFRAFGDTLRTE